MDLAWSELPTLLSFYNFLSWRYFCHSHLLACSSEHYWYSQRKQWGINKRYLSTTTTKSWLISYLSHFCGKWPNKSKSKKEIKDFLGSKLEVIDSVMVKRHVAGAKGVWTHLTHSAEVNRVGCWRSPCCLPCPLCIQPRIPGPGPALATGPRLILSQNAVVTIPQVTLTKSPKIFLNPVKLAMKISQHDWWRASQQPTIN